MKRFIVLLLCLVLTLSLSTPPFINAENVLTGFYGDLDNDMKVSPSDVKIMNDYMFKGNNSDINSKMDLDENKKINIADLVLLKSCINGDTKKQAIYKDDGFLDQITKGVYHPLPSHGSVNIPVFYIDFPDKKFSNKISCPDIKNYLFGPQNEQSENYPFESISAFFERSSKGAMKLSGNVYRYTAINNSEYYVGVDQRQKLIEECLFSLDAAIDFNDFDNDHDGNIDTLIFTVPNSFKDPSWLGFTSIGLDSFEDIDGLEIDKLIRTQEYTNGTFRTVSTYCHELAHCMGVPDYYIYTDSPDADGMYGPAGNELMDADSSSDFSAVSKCTLGWYKKNQAQIFDYSKNEMTFTLNRAQTDNGNCIVIPKNSLWNAASEYFIIEYQKEEYNNTALERLYHILNYFSNGIRVYHAYSETIKPDNYFLAGNENDPDNNGKRFIRLVNDGEPAFTGGDVIDSSVPGFGWYDENEEEAIDPGVSIKINSLDNDKCTVTISTKS